MPDRDIVLEDVSQFNGALIGVGGTFALTSFGTPGSATLAFDDADDNRLFDPGEAATIDGLLVTDTAAGTSTVGVSLAGLITINLGSSVRVNVIETASGTFLHYPDGDQAALLDGLVSTILATPGIGLTLSLLGLGNLSALTAYVEQNALVSFSLTGDIAIPVCFTRGTRIVTARGEIPVETLTPGDRVITRDNGYQKIRWIGHSRVAAAGAFAPILFAPGAIGNARPLMLSPEHRVLIVDHAMEVLLGQRETLIAAKHLTDGTAVRRCEGGFVDYYHILFDQHEIVYANEVLCESFHLGDVARRAIDGAALREILSLFPALGNPAPQTRFETARRVLKKHEARLYMSREYSSGGPLRHRAAGTPLCA